MLNYNQKYLWYELFALQVDNSISDVRIKFLSRVNSGLWLGPTIITIIPCVRNNVIRLRTLTPFPRNWQEATLSLTH